MKKLHKIGFVLILVSISHIAKGIASDTFFFSGLFSRNPTVVSETIERARMERVQRINELIDIVHRRDVETYEGGPLSLAINLLADYRAVEAVQVLSARLDYLPEYPKDRVTMIESWKPKEAFYPCAEALVKIGEPSNTTDIMLGKISGSKSKLERDLAAWVLYKISDKERTIDKLMDAATQSNPTGKIRLLAAADFVRRYQPKIGDDPRSPGNQPRPVASPRKPLNSKSSAP